MVEKKFNFYNVYKVYYKNINESVFFYDLNTFRDFECESFADNLSKIWINYFGIFFSISSNFVLYTDLFVLKTIIKNKKPLLETIFNVKKLFFNKPVFNYTFINFIRKNNINYFLVNLKTY